MLCLYDNNHHDSGSINVVLVWLLRQVLQVSNINYRKQELYFAKSQGLKSCFAIIKGENIMLHFKSKGLGWEMLINLVKGT